MRRPTAALLCATLALASRAVRAQEGADEVVRRELIAEAERARLAGDHAAALDRGRRASRLRSTPSMDYFLAREREALDQPVEALALAWACARGAEADAALRNRDVILRACQALAARVEGRVGRVTVRADALPAGAVVRVAGVALAEVAWGLPRPVAPGTVRVEAEAPGHLAWSRELTVRAGESAEVTVALEAQPPPPPPPPPPVAVAETPRPIAVAPHPPPRVEPSAPVVGPLAAGAAGVAGVVAAGILFAAAGDAQAARDAACPGGQCFDAGVRQRATSLDGDYRAYLLAADVAVGVGAAALAGAALWWVVPRLTSRARPAVAARWGGAAVAW